MGRDKAFLEIDGIPLWQRQLQTLQKLSPKEIFIAGPRRFEWVETGLEIATDAAPDRGPLGGIVAALRRNQASHLLVLAIDLPQMPADYLRVLLSFCRDEHGIVPRRENLFEPLAAIYPRICLSLAEEFLNAPHYSLQEFASEAVSRGWLTAKNVEPAEERFFANMNTPTDLAHLSLERITHNGHPERSEESPNQ